MLIGAHESIRGGFHKAVERAVEDACESLQIFTKAPQMWREPELNQDMIAAFHSAKKDAGELPTMVHVSYLINPCSPKADLVAKSRRALCAEALRCDQLGIEQLVFHPGSPGDAGEQAGIALVAETLSIALAESENVHILIENTAGQGKSVGHTFEQLAGMIDGAGGHPRLGVCFDTCHGFAAGYPLATANEARDTLAHLEQTIGPDKLRAFHLNDSKKECGSRVDRHALIGQGFIGLDGFRYLIKEEKYKTTPAVLETPVEKDATYAAEVALLKSLRS